MAKKRKTAGSPQDSLPSIENAADVSPQVEEVTVTPAESVSPSVLAISVPFLPMDGYARKRVDVTLNGSQAIKLKSIQHGLEINNARLESGRYVSTPMHALQWILENAEAP